MNVNAEVCRFYDFKEVKVTNFLQIQKTIVRKAAVHRLLFIFDMKYKGYNHIVTVTLIVAILPSNMTILVSH